jgi:acetylornithine deacetylase/succinyl-diaminopimelate desuccinylase-like protein
MSLRDSYFDGPTGVNEQMDAAFDAGVLYVTTNLATLTTALVSAAAQGQLQFSTTVTGTGGVNAAYLRGNNGNNLLLKAFFAGIISGLAAEEIYHYQARLQLDVSDSVNTNVLFCFNFGTPTSSCGCGCSSGLLNSSSTVAKPGSCY